MTSPVFVEESKHVYADHGIYGRLWIITSINQPRGVFTNTGTRVIKINLNDSVGVAVLEHFVHNFVFRGRIDVVRDNKAN